MKELYDWMHLKGYGTFGERIPRKQELIGYMIECLISKEFMNSIFYIMQDKIKNM